MGKKCLIVFCGLLEPCNRNDKNKKIIKPYVKTFDNIYENIIQKNLDFEFEIVLSTDFDNCTKENSYKKDESFNFDTHRQQILTHKIGIKEKNIVNFNVDNLKFHHIGPWSTMHLYRLNHINELYDFTKYDLVIYCRTDILINSELRTHFFEDKFCIVRSKYPGLSFISDINDNKEPLISMSDHDFFWAGNPNAFLLFLQKLNAPVLEISDILYNRPNEYDRIILESIGFSCNYKWQVITEESEKYANQYFGAVLDLIKNNYIFRFGDVMNLYADLIPDTSELC